MDSGGTLGYKSIRMHPLRTAIAVALLGALSLGMTCQPGGGAAGDAAMIAHRFARLEGGSIAAKELPFKVLVICFFTTWSDAGILQAKALSNIYERHAQKGFKVIGVVMDLEKAASASPFARQFNIAYPVALAGDDILGGTSPFGNISKVPASYIFDSDGRLLGVWTGVIPAPEMEGLLRRYM